MSFLRKVTSSVILTGGLVLGSLGAANAVPLSDFIVENEVGLGSAATLVDGNIGVVPPVQSFGPVVYTQDTPFTNAFVFQTNATGNHVIRGTTVDENGENALAGNFIAGLTLTLFELSGVFLDDVVAGVTTLASFGSVDSFAVLEYTAGIDALDGVADGIRLDADGNPDTNSSAADRFLNLTAQSGSVILGVVTGDAVLGQGGQNVNYNFGVSSVPLPAPVVLLISALFGLGFLGRRKAKV